jgi:hypothetical protein
LTDQIVEVALASRPLAHPVGEERVLDPDPDLLGGFGRILDAAGAAVATRLLLLFGKLGPEGTCGQCYT